MPVHVNQVPGNLPSSFLWVLQGSDTGEGLVHLVHIYTCITASRWTYPLPVYQHSLEQYSIYICGYTRDKGSTWILYIYHGLPVIHRSDRYLLIHRDIYWYNCIYTALYFPLSMYVGIYIYAILFYSILISYPLYTPY